MRRVRDVERAGEPLDRRPLEPVPREVEQAHRDARVDDPARRDAARAVRRSFQELENSVSASVGRERGGSSAAAISCTYSPTPVRSRSAGR